MYIDSARPSCLIVHENSYAIFSLPLFIKELYILNRQKHPICFCFFVIENNDCFLFLLFFLFIIMIYKPKSITFFVVFWKQIVSVKLSFLFIINDIGYSPTRTNSSEKNRSGFCLIFLFFFLFNIFLSLTTRVMKHFIYCTVEFPLKREPRKFFSKSIEFQ